MDLPSEIIYAFIDKIKPKEELWDNKHKDYKKNALKRKVIVDISRELQREYPDHARRLTPDSCFDKLQYLRSHFQKLLRKMQKTSDESGVKPTCKWEFFKACSFLHPAYKSDTTLNFEMQQSSMVSSKPLKELIREDSPSDLIDDPAVMTHEEEIDPLQLATAQEEEIDPLQLVTTQEEEIDPLQLATAQEEEIDPLQLVTTQEEEIDPLQLATTYVETRLPAPTESSSSASDESSIIPTQIRPGKMRKHRTGNISHTEEQLRRELANVHNVWKNLKKLSAPMDPILESVKGFVKILNESHPHLKTKFHKKMYEAMAEISQEFC
ncbi:uncharacterized protein [Penaeus vannamei]|uniref:uncharacterized protein n=1 Tax=Penaeus vannamei TaxID=6689 RepID=UPI000F669008|nr:uncharacterized protein LOC113803124 isoform X1 [Penaeus vannamei]